MHRVRSGSRPPAAGVRRLLPMVAGLFAFSLSLAAPPDAPAGAPWVRERHRLLVDGTAESWTLAWGEKPRDSSCSPAAVDTTISCPCLGFGYAEQGHLVLTRRRPGEAPDTLALDGLFGLENVENPVLDAHGGASALNRWGSPLARDAERELAEEPGLEAEIRRRPAPVVMRFADYGGDGRATQFLLQVGALPCGHTQFVAVGITRAVPHLHALPSTAHPGTPVVLPKEAWRALASGPGEHTVVAWECGDHGSEVHSELVLSAKDGVVSARLRDYSCPHDPTQPQLVAERPL